MKHLKNHIIWIKHLYEHGYYGDLLGWVGIYGFLISASWQIVKVSISLFML